jgi:hypothetical protein
MTIWLQTLQPVVGVWYQGQGSCPISVDSPMLYPPWKSNDMRKALFEPGKKIMTEKYHLSDQWLIYQQEKSSVCLYIVDLVQKPHSKSDTARVALDKDRDLILCQDINEKK